MDTLHIVCGPAERRGKLPSGRYLVLLDDLTDGILHRDRGVNERLRSGHRGSPVRDLEGVREAVRSLRRFDEVVVWHGVDQAEQFMLPWVVPLLLELEVPQDMIRLAHPLDREDQPVRARQAEGRDLARGYMLRRPPDQKTQDLLHRLWDALTADGPDMLHSLTARELQRLPHWAAARDTMLSRYPDATGLGVHDRVILAQCTRRWRPAERVVKSAVAEADALAPTTERAIWRRIVRLVGDAGTPGALGLRSEGYLDPMDSEICLTDLGIEAVQGTVDLLAHLPLTEWIGGTLLQSPDRIWRWTERGLERDFDLEVSSQRAAGSGQRAIGVV